MQNTAAVPCAAYTFKQNCVSCLQSQQRADLKASGRFVVNRSGNKDWLFGQHFRDKLALLQLLSFGALFAAAAVVPGAKADLVSSIPWHQLPPKATV